MKLENKKLNERMIKKIALALGDLNGKVVYVGGAVVNLYANDPAAEDVRPTKDIDVFLEITSFGKLTKLQEELTAKGFHATVDEGVICRFRYEEILLDVMATEAVGWASTDKWFEPGMQNLVHMQIEDVTINMLNLPYFLATKFNAFHDRREDARTSKHFEDIVFLLDNRVNLVTEILHSPDDVKNFLIQQFQALLKVEYKEAFFAHLFYQTQVERYNIIKEKLINIVSG